MVGLRSCQEMNCPKGSFFPILEATPTPREPKLIQTGSGSVLLLGSQGVGGQVGQEIWDDTACSDYLGQERRNPDQHKGIDALGEADIYEFMDVPGLRV